MDQQTIMMISAVVVAGGIGVYIYLKKKKAAATTTTTTTMTATPAIITVLDHPAVVDALAANTAATKANTAAVTATASTAAPVAAAPVVVPVPVTPTVAVSGNPIQVDPVVPPGTPNTVTLPETGHTLSLPMVAQGESLIGYCGRVSLQAGGDEVQKGGLIYMQLGGPSHTGNPLVDWPILVDWFFNRDAYMTPAQSAVAAAAAAK